MNQQVRDNYDSEFCGNVPIHLINVVQPYGALVVFDKTEQKIIQVSENIQNLVGLPVNEILGSRLSQHLSGLSVGSKHEREPQVVRIRDERYLAILHSQPQYHLLEINVDSKEEAMETSFINVYQELRTSINVIENAGSLDETIRIVAKELKKLSRFDKVMIYRFDDNWNGHVMAEEKEYDMESYLGFTFPASDIPKQARDLYLKNPYRYIPDISYQAVKLMPVINPATNTFIDMSDCNVRGVSAVHLEYLANMKIQASMSTRIVNEGKLWGLIACHHKTPRSVNYKMCAIFELLSGILTNRIATLEGKEQHRLNARLSEIYTSIVEDAYRNKNIIKSLLAAENNVLELFNATGAVAVHNGVIETEGNVPDGHDLEDILLWLQTRTTDKIYATDKLSSDFDYAAEFTDVASGLLAIPIDVHKDEYLLLFRPEVKQVINWGGDPATRITFDKDMTTYHPRFSFSLWQQQVEGVSLPWNDDEVAVAADLREFILDFTGNSERKKHK